MMSRFNLGKRSGEVKEVLKGKKAKVTWEIAPAALIMRF